MTDTDVALTPLALELKAYFRARLVCLQADPPCPLRPCARHHAEAATALGSVPCGACDGVGLVATDPEPCIRCDGWGRLWNVSSALASASPSEGARLLAEGADGAAGAAGSAASLGLAAPPSDSSPPPASHAEGGGTGHRYGPEESMP